MIILTMLTLVFRIEFATAAVHGGFSSARGAALPSDPAGTAGREAHLPHSRAGRGAPEHEFGGGRPPAAPEARGRAGGGNPNLGMPKDLVASDGVVAWTAAHAGYGKVVAVHAEPAARERYGLGEARDGVLGRAAPIQSPFRLLGQIPQCSATGAAVLGCATSGATPLKTTLRVAMGRHRVKRIQSRWGCPGNIVTEHAEEWSVYAARGGRC